MEAIPRSPSAALFAEAVVVVVAVGADAASSSREVGLPLLRPITIGEPWVQRPPAEL